MGRSRGGLTTKLHALIDADARPVSLRLTGGQVHDACEAEAGIKGFPEGATLLGDKGYDSTAIREAAPARNIWANIPNRSNRKQRFGFGPDNRRTALTDDGIAELRDMITAARQSPDGWDQFLEDFVDDPDVIRTVKALPKG